MNMNLKKKPEEYIKAIDLLSEFCIENEKPELGWLPSMAYYLEMSKVAIKRDQESNPTENDNN